MDRQLRISDCGRMRQTLYTLIAFVALALSFGCILSVYTIEEWYHVIRRTGWRSLFQRAQNVYPKRNRSRNKTRQSATVSGNLPELEGLALRIEDVAAHLRTRSDPCRNSASAEGHSTPDGPRLFQQTPDYQPQRSSGDALNIDTGRLSGCSSGNEFRQKKSTRAKIDSSRISSQISDLSPKKFSDDESSDESTSRRVLPSQFSPINTDEGTSRQSAAASWHENPPIQVSTHSYTGNVYTSPRPTPAPRRQDTPFRDFPFHNSDNFGAVSSLQSAAAPSHESTSLHSLAYQRSGSKVGERANRRSGARRRPSLFSPVIETDVGASRSEKSEESWSSNQSADKQRICGILQRINTRATIREESTEESRH